MADASPPLFPQQVESKENIAADANKSEVSQEFYCKYDPIFFKEMMVKVNKKAVSGETAS